MMGGRAQNSRRKVAQIAFRVAGLSVIGPGVVSGVRWHSSFWLRAPSSLKGEGSVLDSRKSKRARCLRMAWVTVNDGADVVAVVADYSTRGLRLRTAYKAFVCETIQVRFADGEVRRGLVSWVAEGQLGLEMEVPPVLSETEYVRIGRI